MRNHLLLLSFVAVHLGALAQTRTVKGEPKWMVGDQRRLTVTHGIKGVAGDSIMRDLKAVDAYVVSLPELRREGPLFNTHLEQHELLSAAMDERVKAITRHHPGVKAAELRAAMEQVNEPLFNSNWQFIVNSERNVVPAFTLEQLKERFKPALLERITDLMAVLPKPEQRTASQLDQQVEHMLDSVLLDHQRNHQLAIELVAGVFARTWPTEGAERIPAVLKELEVPLFGTVAGVAATEEIGLDANTKEEFTGRVITTADPAALHKALQAAGITFIAEDGLSMRSETMYATQRPSGWLTSASRDLTLRNADMRITATMRCTVERIGP